MKVWLALKIFGTLVGSVGPLPYDVAECRERLPDFVQGSRDDIASAPPQTIDGRTVLAEDFSAECMEADSRPTPPGARMVPITPGNPTP